MFIVFGRKIPWFDGGDGKTSVRPQMATAGSSRGSDRNRQNSKSNREVEDGGKSRSRRDEEFDSAVQLQRSYYNPRNSPGISDEVGQTVSEYVRTLGRQ